jgi:hypothetical protein
VCLWFHATELEMSCGMERGLTERAENRFICSRSHVDRLVKSCNSIIVPVDQDRRVPYLNTPVGLPP